MKQITIALAGCGNRGMDTYAQCQKRFPDRMKIVAAADTNEERLKMMCEQFGLSREQCFHSAEEMLEQERLADAMIIATTDQMHYGEAMSALEKGYHLLLEKPISLTEKECRDIIALAKKQQRQVIVCHVLRYTVFYQKLKELIDTSMVGDIVSVQAIEKVGYWHQGHSFVRGNWRNSDLSSPMILQKCCHDMDIILWLTGKHCKLVSSFGSLMHYTPENAPKGAPMYCVDGCPVADECPYNAVTYYMNRLNKGEKGWPLTSLTTDPTEENVLEALKGGPFGRCVYHCDNNVVDHQVVNLLLEDGVTVNFTMCAFTKECARHIRIMGTKGEIYGDLQNNTIQIFPFMGEDECIDVSKLMDDFSGHSGGDPRMVDMFLNLIAGEPYDMTTLSSVDMSLESHVVAFAAEKSRLNGGQVQSIEL